MFNPSRDEVRRFFIDAWSKHRGRLPLVGLGTTAVDVMLLHPEYHALLEQAGTADRDYRIEDGEANPFLHLSLHLAIEEQLGIDQPPGIRGEFVRLCAQAADRHAALHGILECLGETVWAAQRYNTPLDMAAYMDCIRRRES
ncbi:MAG: DUF1841 family protein [Betaproteobacteria bacterium]|nr:DUF1841 family protein [Betaproteobacteria bacterium]